MKPTCQWADCTEPVGYRCRQFCGPEHLRLGTLERHRRYNATRVGDRSGRRHPRQPPFVDPVAVLRVVGGDRVELNRSERRAAVALLTRRGLTAAAIAERVGVSARSVTRHRAAIRQEHTA
jgi:hypothetical protein